MHFVTCTLKSTILICSSPWMCLTFGAAWRAGRHACECIGTSIVIQLSVGDYAVSQHVFRTLWVENYQESFVSPHPYNVCLFFSRFFFFFSPPPLPMQLNKSHFPSWWREKGFEAWWIAAVYTGGGGGRKNPDQVICHLTSSYWTWCGANSWESQ